MTCGNVLCRAGDDPLYEVTPVPSSCFHLNLSMLLLFPHTCHGAIHRNPQADLQAQDRAHRIGQKKPVQVFRLVTDETVEVKVVERAQQKLKLDAMVVQQGRLQDKEKKMSKDELLETLRFGADKVFRSKDSSITDNDIDIILEEGRKRTEQIAEQLQTAEKGDMYDFKLDGGMGTQVFEGKDYSDKAMRQQELNALAGIPFIDPGKRERKAISTYAETIARQAEREEVDKRQKIPRHLRLPRMDDWQFFDKARLQELHTEEVKLFDAMVDRGEAPQAGSISKFTQVLPDDLHAEKTRLLEQGFGDWTRVHFNSFVRATAKHGRAAHEKIAKDVGRPLDETRRYAEAFWSKGQTELPGNEWDRAIKQIEKVRSVGFSLFACAVVCVCAPVCLRLIFLDSLLQIWMLLS